MYYLGIDGGGTKTAFILINEDGEIISFQTKGSCHYVQVGMDTFRQVLSEGITEVTGKAGINNSDLAYVFCGLPGYGEIKKDITILEGAVKTLLQNSRFRCGNDVEAGWAGSLACQPGINLVGGTGAIGFGKDQSGKMARAGGWGYYCGDEGSAYWLGKKLISLFGKEADGREEKTPIYGIVRQKFGISNDFELITIVYDKLQMKRDKIAELALILYEAAIDGDQKAIAIYQEAAYEYSLIVKALLNKLQFMPEKEVSVSYSGGVFKAGEFILKPLKEFLSKERVKFNQPILQPVTGAALYALFLEREKIDDAVLKKLKTEEERVLRL
jgi:N-acetylglucosamine kinase-like BadF-type ATPase